MATIISAGNATNGAAISSDSTGVLNINTGTGSGTTAIAIDASQNVVVTGNLQTSGVTTNHYPLVSGTLQSPTSGTSVDFTSAIPSWAKRVTILLNTATISAGGNFAIQLITGTNTVVATGYTSTAMAITSGSTTEAAGPSTRYQINSTATTIFTGSVRLQNISGTIWIMDSTGSNNSSLVHGASGFADAAAALTGVRITTVAGTSTFSSGTINILYE